jgi:hypothetical protein
LKSRTICLCIGDQDDVRTRGVADTLRLAQPAIRCASAGPRVDPIDAVIAKLGDWEPPVREIDCHVIDPAHVVQRNHRPPSNGGSMGRQRQQRDRAPQDKTPNRTDHLIHVRVMAASPDQRNAATRAAKTSGCSISG